MNKKNKEFNLNLILFLMINKLHLNNDKIGLNLDEGHPFSFIDNSRELTEEEYKEINKNIKLSDKSEVIKKFKDLDEFEQFLNSDEKIPIKLYDDLL